MAAELDPDVAAVDAALTEWRRQAAQIVLTVVAAAHLPVLVLGMLGHGPPMGWLLTGIGIAAYLILAAAALLWRIDYRPRLLAALVAVYLGLAATYLFLPHGAYAKNVATVPVFALVLLGPAVARMTVLASTAIIVAAPLLWAQPGVVRALGIDPAQVADPPGVVWFRTTVLAATLLTLMVLLDRFHRFLLDTLSQRIVAQRKMQHEMRQRQRLEREIAASADRERRRLGQDLHDGVCQQVTAALLRCQALERRLQQGGTLSSKDLAPLSTLLADTVGDAHDVARGLCPLDPDPDALAPALLALTRRTEEMTGVRCQFLAAGEVRVPDPDAAQHLYRIAQEALSNAARHAHARGIMVELRGSRGELTLQVQDDGGGLPATLPSGGMGLRIMAYRAQILDGQLIVASAPGGGTRVTCRVPRAVAASAGTHRSEDERWIPAP